MEINAYTTRIRRRELTKLAAAGSASLAAATLLGACVTTSYSGANPTAPAASSSSAPAGAGASANGQSAPAAAGSWELLLSAGQAEGKVVVAGAPDAGSRQQLPDALKARFGIDMDYLSDSSAVASRLDAERTAGQFTVDVIMGGTNSFYGTLLANGWLDPLKSSILLPDAADGSKWKAGQPWFRDPTGETVLQLFATVSQAITINTQLVSPQEVATADALLDPKWTGKICAFDPTVNGSGLNTSATFYLNKGADFAAKLYKGQNVTLSRDYNQVADWVAHGSYPIAIAADLTYLKPYSDAGITFAQPELPDAPNVLGGGFGLIGVLNQAPHPNAARVFANWIASQEGMAMYALTQIQVPVRNDIDPTWVTAQQIPDPNKSYLDTYSYDFQTTQIGQVRNFYTQLLK